MVTLMSENLTAKLIRVENDDGNGSKKDTLIADLTSENRHLMSEKDHLKSENQHLQGEVEYLRTQLCHLRALTNIVKEATP